MKQTDIGYLLFILTSAWCEILHYNLNNYFKTTKSEFNKKILSLILKNISKTKKGKIIKKGKKYKSFLENGYEINYEKLGKKFIFLEKFKKQFGFKPNSKLRKFFFKKSISKKNFDDFIEILKEKPFCGDKEILKYNEENFQKYKNTFEKYKNNCISKNEEPWNHYMEKDKDLVLLAIILFMIASDISLKMDDKYEEIEE